MPRYFVTVNGKPYGAAFATSVASAIASAKSAKAEFPNADVVAWQHGCDGYDHSEIWENHNTEGQRL